jgi:cytochrome c-type biogenesis protein
MRELVLNWYSLLNTVYATVAFPLRELADGIGLPLVSALIFGLMGAASPCQLTTGASALAFVTCETNNRRLVAARAGAYLLGKALVYTVLGLATIVLGRQLAESSIPIIVVARKILGPVMIMLGLYVLGWIPLRFSVGQSLAQWLEGRAGSGVSGSFVLGTAFSIAFCPTLFLLFFGLTIPMALSSPVGVLYPGVFALGMTLPLLGIAVIATVGVRSAQGAMLGAQRIGAVLRPLSALILVLSGLNDTVVYWFI